MARGGRDHEGRRFADATFVTTWMEPGARQVIEGNLQSAERGWMLPAYAILGPKRVAAAGD